jgi:hypothetical protein
MWRHVINNLLLTVKRDSSIHWRTRNFEHDYVIDCKTRILLLTVKHVFSQLYLQNFYYWLENTINRDSWIRGKSGLPLNSHTTHTLPAWSRKWSGDPPVWISVYYNSTLNVPYVLPPHLYVIKGLPWHDPHRYNKTTSGLINSWLIGQAPYQQSIPDYELIVVTLSFSRRTPTSFFFWHTLISDRCVPAYLSGPH